MKRRAFSMVEVVISALVLGLMVASALNATGLSAQIRGGQTAKNRAQIICSEMISEMRSKPLPDSLGTLPVSAAPGNRSTYDDLFDYCNYMGIPPVDENGSEIPGAANWWVRVVIAWVDPNDITQTSTDPTGMLRLHVSVRRGLTVLASVSTLRSVHTEAAIEGGEP